MVFPKMVQKFMLNANVHVSLGSDTLSEDGELMPAFEADLQGNIQFKQIQKLTAQKQEITINGKILFDGDICPEIKRIDGGTLIYNGVTYDVYQGQRHLNPDGSVNYTSLELM